MPMKWLLTLQALQFPAEKENNWKFLLLQPPPHKINTAADEYCVVIEFDMMSYKKRTNTKTIKKTLTIPEWLNEEALSLGINFSQVLQEALLKKIDAKL